MDLLRKLTQDFETSTTMTPVKRKGVYWYECTVQVDDGNGGTKDCGAKFCSAGACNKHLVDTHGRGDTFACNQCREKFTYKSALVRHVNQVHDMKYRYVCTMCTGRGSRTHSKDAFNQHLFTKHQVGVPGFAWNHCQN